MAILHTHAPSKVVSIDKMPMVTATELKNATADVLDRIAAHHAVVMTRHDKPRVVLLSVERYESLIADHAGHRPDWLDALDAEYTELLEQMQSQKQCAGAERAFKATSKALGNAALRGARRTSLKKLKNLAGKK